jgi:2-keto-4-pentenoate hydratase
MGEAERIGQGPAVGHLTSATEVEPDATFVAGDAGALHADVELAVEIGPGGAIAGYAPALELVDLAGVGADAAAIVASNIFHLGFTVGAFHERPPAALRAELLVNGARRAAGLVEDVDERVAAAEQLLAAVGEGLRPGDRVLTGSIMQQRVAPGDALVADLADLGRVSVHIGSLPASPL